MSGCLRPAPPAGTSGAAVVYDTVRSEALAGNPLGDPVERDMVVLLPPGYAEAPARRYPVLYLLHGFDGSSRQFLDSRFGLPSALDSLVRSGAIQPMIVALPDGRNRWGGSFFANSPATGRWETHLVEEVVAAVDDRYRTLASPAARGIAGWSMGGRAALEIAARHPDRFGAVYALSPCCLGAEMLVDYGPDHPAWREIAERARGTGDGGAAGFHARLLLAVAALRSPLPGRAPFGVELPFDGEGGAAAPVLARWRAEGAAEWAARNADALRRLGGIGVDAGTGDAFRHIPASVRALSEGLAGAGVEHRYEAYRGTHGSAVPERLRGVVLPFFSERLGPTPRSREAPGARRPAPSRGASPDPR